MTATVDLIHTSTLYPHTQIRILYPPYIYIYIYLSIYPSPYIDIHSCIHTSKKISKIPWHLHQALCRRTSFFASFTWKSTENHYFTSEATAKEKHPTRTHTYCIYIYNNHLGLCLQPTIVCFINLDMQMRSTSTCTHINRELFFPWEFSSSWSKSKTSRIFIQSEIPGWSNYVESKHLWIHGIHWWKVKWMV